MNNLNKMRMKFAQTISNDRDDYKQDKVLQRAVMEDISWKSARKLLKKQHVQPRKSK